jgi:hypothetical protein
MRMLIENMVMNKYILLSIKKALINNKMIDNKGIVNNNMV